MVEPRVKAEAETVTKPEGAKQAPKTLAGRVPFPRNPLKEALRIPDAIWKHNAGEPFDPILLATAMDTTPRSSIFVTLLISSERYGLTVGGVFAKAIAMTDTARAIVAPTDESKVGQSLREALLKPKVFSQVYSKYNRKNIPREDIIKIVLERECGVPRADTESCYKVIMQNVKDYNLTLQSGSSNLLWLDNLGKESKGPVQAQESPATQPEETEILLSAEGPTAASAQAQPEVKIPRVFISHSKNKKILDNMKQTLSFGKFDFRVAEEKETLSMPLSDKVFGLMRECNCAIINVSADQEKKEGESYSINENVLIEIGAAFLYYDKRVLLVIDHKLKERLPTILQGITAIFYEGQELTLTDGMKLMKVLDEFRNKL